MQHQQSVCNFSIFHFFLCCVLCGIYWRAPLCCATSCHHNQQWHHKPDQSNSKNPRIDSGPKLKDGFWHFKQFLFTLVCRPLIVFLINYPVIRSNPESTTALLLPGHLYAPCQHSYCNQDGSAHILTSLASLFQSGRKQPCFMPVRDYCMSNWIE